MFGKTIFLLFIFSITASEIPAWQENSDSTDQENSDSTDEDFGEYKDKWKDKWEKFDFEMDMFDGSPTVSLNYGFSKMNLDKFSGSFADPTVPEIKLGYTTQKPYKHSDGILRYKFRYIFLGSFRNDISNSAEDDEIKSTMWRFGFGEATGYGYNFGDQGIIPYFSYSLDWSRLEFENLPSDTSQVKILKRYNEAFRFGSASEAGLKIKVIPQLILEAGYERSIIFERHLFWKWAGSAVIEAIGHFALDSFIDEIMESSPYAGPVVFFILKSALAYGVYELRQEKMNWPFNSAAPLANDQFKVGLTFNF